MEFLISYWWVALLVIAVCAVVGYFVYTFLKMPTNSQINKVREWLLFAVTEAEKELGGGTGQIKLRYVYDMFIAKFPFLVKAISFESFELLVDEVLETFREMLDQNEALQLYVNGEIKPKE